MKRLLPYKIIALCSLVLLSACAQAQISKADNTNWQDVHDTQFVGAVDQNGYIGW